MILGAFPARAQNVSGTGTITIATGTTLVSNADNSSGTWSGTLDGDGNFEKAGTGTLTFNGQNFYTGTTTVSGGTLVISGGLALYDNGQVIVNSGATFQVNSAENIGSIAGAGSVVLNGSVATNNGASTVFSGNLSGSGTLIMRGSGTLTLSGTNTNSGGLNVSAGSVILSGGAAISDTARLTMGGGSAELQSSETVGSLVGTSAINLNANTLTVAGAETTSYSGVISGTGALVKSGSGTQTLTGTSTYIGGTLLNAGTLSVSQDQALGGTSGGLTFNGGTLATTASFSSARSMVFNNAGRFEVAGSTDLTLTGALSGSGGLVKSGSGTLTLTGTNTYSGTTTISGGTLRVGDGNTSGSLGTGNVTNNGALVFNRSDSVTFAGDMSGTGTLEKAGTGTLILTGTNTYSGGTTISGGTLRVGDGNTSGSLGTGNVTNNSALVFNRSDAVTFAGGISGTGTLEKAGTGTLTLTGTNTYSGTTTISGGTLQVGDGSASGSLGASNITNNSALVFNRSGAVTFAGSISGTGTLEKAGTGTLTLTGTNTYSGTTTISGGTLQVGDGSTSGSLGTGNITNNGALAFNRSDAVTFAGGMSGTGTLEQAGSGTLTLTGTNTYSGGTLLKAGTLSVSQDQTLGGTSGSLTFDGGTLATTASFSSARSMVFNNAGRFDVAGSTNLTLTGALSGSGGLVKFGSGTLTLTGTSTYSGGTTISGGTLRVGDGNTSGSLGTGNVTNNGALVFNRSDSVTFAGDMSGTGTLEQAGSGTLVITGLVNISGNTTVSSGKLQIGNGGTSGAVSGTIVNNGTLIFNRSGQYTVSNQITGTGSINFTGGGSVAFAGTYSGSAAVTDARLVLTGGGLTGSAVSLGGVAGKTGTLAGNGTIGRLNVLSGGIVAPGNSIGTINVAGPVSFAAGSIYEVEVNANGGSDRIIATGTVTIDSGASVRMLAESGNYSASTTYTILSGSSVSGSFNPVVSSNFAFLEGSLSYSATGVLLTLTRNETSFSQVAVTPNEIAAAAGLDSMPRSSDLKEAVTGLSAGGARNAFNQVSGEAHVSAAGQLLEDSAILRGTALRRLSQEAFERRFEGGDFAFEGARVWGEALGSFGRSPAANTIFGFSRNLGGLVGGIEARPTEQALAGFMAGYTGSHLDTSALGSTATVSAYHAALYGSYDLDATDEGTVSLRGGAVYSWQDFSTRRNVNFAGVSQRVEADYGTGQVQGFGELAYGHVFTGVMQGAFLEGFTGLALVHQDGAKFTETGGSAALTGSGTALETAFTTVGVRGAVQGGIEGIPVRLTGELAWRHAFGDVSPLQTMTLPGSNPFGIRGQSLDRDVLLIGTGLDMTMTDRLDFSLAYQGELSAKATDHSVKGSFRLRF